MSLLEKVFIVILPLLQVSEIGAFLNFGTFSSVFKNVINYLQI